MENDHFNFKYEKAKEQLELSLTDVIVEYLDVSEIERLVAVFVKRTSFYYDVMKYRRKVHQFAYKSYLYPCIKGEEVFADKLLNLIARPESDQIDFLLL